MFEIILAIVFVLVVFSVLFNNKVGVMLKGAYNMIFEDMAKTPEGAKAIYTKALDEAQDKYTRANNNLQLIAGKLATAKDSLADSQKELTRIETACIGFASKGDDKNLEVYASRRMEILDDIELHTTTIDELTPMLEDAKKMNDALAENYRALSREKDRVIAQLKLGRDMKSVYDSMDSLKADSDIQKLLGSAKTGAKEMKEQAIGAKIVHEGRLETKLQNAQVAEKKANAQAYIDELKAKSKKVSG